jgi:transcription elongation factor GreA
MFNLESIIERLKAEAEELEYELKVELAREIGAAIEQGDISENAEYESAKERQSTLIGRLDQMNKRIEELAKIKMDEIPRDRVSLGSTVNVTDLDTGEKKRYVLVPPEAMDSNPDYISIMSPIARNLVGAYPGDEVFVKVPKGEREYRVERVITFFGDVLE